MVTNLLGREIPADQTRHGSPMNDEVKIKVEEILTDADQAKVKEGLEKVIAGKKPKPIDRTKFAYTLVPDPKDPNILIAFDGTRYEKSKSGTLKRLTIRPSELPKVKKNGK